MVKNVLGNTARERDIPVRKPVAGVMLIALLSILIMFLGNTRYLAIPAVAVPAASDRVEAVARNELLFDGLDLQSGYRYEPREGATLRVMTYNIHYGAGVSGELDLEQTVATIRAADADIIALQEVDSNFGQRSEFQDQPALLASYLGMHYVYGESLRIQHLMPGRGIGYYGNMILSRYPIVDSQILRLPVRWGTEPRTALKATIATPQGQVVVWSTHLGLSHRDRLEQVRTLLAAVDRETWPSVLLGDFNALPHSPEMRVIAEGMQDAAGPDGNSIGTFYTGPSQPVPRIDYVWLDQNFKVESYEVIQSQASDHLAVVADIVVLSEGRQGKTGNVRGE